VSIEIAPMRLRHLRGVVRIERATSHRPWSTNLFQGELKLTSRHYVVALDGATVVGYGGLMFTGYEAHVTLVAVDPERHRQGIGAQVMGELMEECRRREIEDVTLEVRMSNHAAQELYRRFGFAPGGVRKGYYSDVGEDALIMWAHEVAHRSGEREGA